jgi:OOP family OmpA-OmpF porin
VCSLRQYFISYDIEESRMISKGFGEEKPSADNKNNAGLQSNRRVEIHILKVDQSKVIHDIKLEVDIKK